MNIRSLSKACTAALLALTAATPALAADLTLAKSDATDLVQGDVGKPYWALESQCAGLFGAAYAYENEHARGGEAEGMKQNGIRMLESALARLQADRGIDRNAAMTLAADQVENGRALGKASLAKYGDGEASGWNQLRSACLDIADAERRHAGAN